MKSRIEKALERRQKGYNCSQAVLCTYADRAGMDEETAYRVAEAFGTGMGGMQETCGAVTAMFLLAGMLAGSAPGDRGKRAETYKTVRMLSKAFQDMNGSTVCRELKGWDGKPVLRSCNGCIEDACHLIEKLLLEKENTEV